MRYITNTHELNIENPYGNSIFFDIETTGLNRDKAFIYLIGVGVLFNNTYTIHQWFADSKDDEVIIINNFLSFIESYDTLIHYNGNSFDIPFVNHRAKCYGISGISPSINSIDIYKNITPYKNILKLTNLQQKTIELFLDINRDDIYDGGKLINIYKSYTKNPSDDALSHLLLHNHDDMLGIARLMVMENYVKLFIGQADIKINNSYLNSYKNSDNETCEELIYEMTTDTNIPKKISYGNDDCYIIVKDNIIVLKVKLFDGKLKYYHDNYKDYYYLPTEDMAIHKSVATFVDKSHRKPATANNCYSKINYTDELLTNIDYVKNVISHIK